MPDIDDIHRVIRQRFQTRIDAYPGDVPMGFDNTELFTPGGLATDRPDDGEWVVCYILDGESVQIEGGSSKRIRHPGVVEMQVFGTSGIGTNRVASLAAHLQRYFNCVTADEVTYRASSIRNVGRDGKWFQVNVSCPFYSDEIV